MKNGFIVPPRNKRHKKYTSKLDFLTYFQIKNFLAKHHAKPRYAVTQHDDDKLTYAKAYSVIAMLKRANEINLRLISDIISLLYSKNVLTKSDEINLIKHVKKRS